MDVVVDTCTSKLLHSYCMESSQGIESLSAYLRGQSINYPMKMRVIRNIVEPAKRIALVIATKTRMHVMYARVLDPSEELLNVDDAFALLNIPTTSRPFDSTQVSRTLVRMLA